MLQEASATAAAANETEAVEYEEVSKSRKRTVRLPLTIAGPGLVMPGMSAEQLKVRSVLHGNSAALSLQDCQNLLCLLSYREAF